MSERPELQRGQAPTPFEWKDDYLWWGLGISVALVAAIATKLLVPLLLLLLLGGCVLLAFKVVQQHNQLQRTKSRVAELNQQLTITKVRLESIQAKVEAQKKRDQKLGEVEQEVQQALAEASESFLDQARKLHERQQRERWESFKKQNPEIVQWLEELQEQSQQLTQQIIQTAYRLPSPDSPGRIETDLEIGENFIRGTITNRSGKILEAGSLKLKYGVVPLPGMKPDETKEVNLRLADAASTDADRLTPSPVPQSA